MAWDLAPQPAHAQDDFTAATDILSRHGLSVVDAAPGRSGHEVVTVRVLPREDVEYDLALSDLNAAGVPTPRLRTAYCCGLARATLLHSSVPCPLVRAESGPGGSALEFLGPLGPRLPATSAGAPGAEHLEIAVLDRDASLRVKVGERIYRLAGGDRLVEEEAGQSAGGLLL